MADQPTGEVGRKSAKRFTGSTTDQPNKRRPGPSGVVPAEAQTVRQPDRAPAARACWKNGCGRTPERERGLAPALRGGLSPKTGRHGDVKPAKTNPRPSNLVLSFSRLPATSVVATNGQREGGWQEIGRVSGSMADQLTREVGRKSAKRFTGSTTDQPNKRRPGPSGVAPAEAQTVRQPDRAPAARACWKNGCGRTPERERGLAPALRGGLSPKTGRRGA